MEFLQASGEEMLYDTLMRKTAFDPVPDILHEKLTGLLRTYLYLGGMPEVVCAFIETKDYSAVREIQNDIIKSYERDFSKYSTPTQAIRISEIWRSIPAQLARESKKFKYSDVRKGGRASQFESAIEWLRSAGLLYISTCVTAARLPLKGYEDHGRFKAYVLDCGLLGAMVDLPSRVLVRGDALFAEYNGAFIENFTAAELAKRNDGILNYWLSEGVAEVDFLVRHENEILPLEVKSGRKRNVRSLRIFAQKYGSTRVYRASPRNFECRDDFANIPLYAIDLFPALR
jgi:hypothetical protein